MQSFTLHDGENDKVTENLHAFLRCVSDDALNEWEGHESGIDIWLRVRAGDVILRHDDGAVRVLREDQPVIISPHTFPSVFEAMLEIEMDNGAHHVNRIHGAGTIDLEKFKMPWAYGVSNLVESEVALRNLIANHGREKFKDLCVDSEDVQFEIIKLDEGLETAHALLNDWFNRAADGTWDRTPQEAE